MWVFNKVLISSIYIYTFSFLFCLFYYCIFFFNCITKTICDQIWGILHMQCITALHCSPSVSFIVGSIHLKVRKVAHYTSFSKLSPQSDDVSQTSDSTPPVDVHLTVMTASLMSISVVRSHRAPWPRLPDPGLFPRCALWKVWLQPFQTIIAYL